MAEAVARAAGRARGRRCAARSCCAATSAPVAEAALRRRGAAGLRGLPPARSGRPLQPMLAPTARRHRRGARHGRRRPRSSGSSTAPASRCTATATSRRLHPQPRRHHRPRARGGRRPPWPCRCRGAVLDGEAIALEPRRPAAAVPGDAPAGSAAADVERLAPGVPLTPFFFDLLHLDGAGPARPPGAERRAALAAPCPSRCGCPRVVDRRPGGGRARSSTTRWRRGHEGVVVKSLDAPYEAGRRGAGWLKVKPVHTLDLVVLAVEWGHGRRQRLAVQPAPRRPRPRTGGFVMLGKTFKGLTDEMLPGRPSGCWSWPSTATSWVVHVRPELVVEIAFDGVQTSPRYPGGVALRFARVLRYREDKRAEEADTIDDGPGHPRRRPIRGVAQGVLARAVRGAASTCAPARPAARARGPGRPGSCRPASCASSRRAPPGWPGRRRSRRTRR